MPTHKKLSATLNVGKVGANSKYKKSLTPPRKIRSIKFPHAPPTTNDMAMVYSGCVMRSLLSTIATIRKNTTVAAMSSHKCSPKNPHAPPVFSPCAFLMPISPGIRAKSLPKKTTLQIMSAAMTPAIMQNFIKKFFHSEFVSLLMWLLYNNSCYFQNKKSTSHCKVLLEK